MSGILVISLDFELHWGAFEKKPLPQWSQYYMNTRKLIPELLNIFSEYEIQATWATVGMLMHSTKEALMAHCPAEEPSYLDEQLSPYHYIRHTGIGENEKEDPFHFAADLLKQIKKTAGQEIGTHTFGHYYCNEPGQTIQQFDADLTSAIMAAEPMNIVPRSLVFPRNQFNSRYLEICKAQGIVAVRTNPNSWFWKIDTKAETWYKRIRRGLDAYLPFGASDNRYKPSQLYRKELPLLLPASRILRPFHPKERWLNTWKQQRIFREMTAAAREHSIYHLWWHPHNFGHFPAENLEMTRQICAHARKLKLRSMTMGSLAGLITSTHGN
jgi:peptidoglycan/xylan/chitin deacetylase (PgdA/CDA1 family)